MSVNRVLPATLIRGIEINTVCKLISRHDGKSSGEERNWHDRAIEIDQRREMKVIRGYWIDRPERRAEEEREKERKNKIEIVVSYISIIRSSKNKKKIFLPFDSTTIYSTTRLVISCTCIFNPKITKTRSFAR